MAMHRVIRPWFSAGALLTLVACSSDTPTNVNGIPSRTFETRVGQVLDIQLQTVGPGEYRTPPTISASVVTFTGAELVTPTVPAGPTQLFHFRAVAPGQAVVTFAHTVGAPLADTIDVK